MFIHVRSCLFIQAQTNLRFNNKKKSIPEIDKTL